VREAKDLQWRPTLPSNGGEGLGNPTVLGRNNRSIAVSKKRFPNTRGFHAAFLYSAQRSSALGFQQALEAGVGSNLDRTVAWHAAQWSVARTIPWDVADLPAFASGPMLGSWRRSCKS